MSFEASENLEFNLEQILPIDVANATNLFIKGQLAEEDFYEIIKACKGSGMYAGFGQPYGYSFGFLDDDLKPGEKYEATKRYIDFNKWEADFNNELRCELANLISTEQEFLNHSIVFLDTLQKRGKQPKVLRSLNESEKSAYVGSRIMQLPPTMRGLFNGQRPPSLTEEGGDLYIRFRRESEHHEIYEQQKSKKQEVALPELVENHLEEMLGYVLEAAEVVSPILKKLILSKYKECADTAQKYGREHMWDYFGSSIIGLIYDLVHFHNFPDNAEDILRLKGRMELLYRISFYHKQCQEGELNIPMYGDINKDVQTLIEDPTPIYFNNTSRPDPMQTAMHSLPSYYFQWEYLKGNIPQEFVRKYFPETFKNRDNFDYDKFSLELDFMLNISGPHGISKLPLEEQKFFAPNERELTKRSVVPKIKLTTPFDITSSFYDIEFANSSEFQPDTLFEEVYEEYTGAQMGKLETVVPLAIETVPGRLVNPIFADNEELFIVRLPHVFGTLPGKSTFMVEGNMLLPYMYTIHRTPNRHHILVLSPEAKAIFGHRTLGKGVQATIDLIEDEETTLSSGTNLLKTLATPKDIEKLNVVFEALSTVIEFDHTKDYTLATIITEVGKSLEYAVAEHSNAGWHDIDLINAPEWIIERTFSSDKDPDIYFLVSRFINALKKEYYGRPVVTCEETAKLNLSLIDYILGEKGYEFYKSDLFPRLYGYAPYLPSNVAVYGSKHTDIRSLAGDVIDTTPELPYSLNQNKMNKMIQAYIKNLI